MTLEQALLLIGAYALGSIPFGLLIARSRGIDITKVGSGNIGATNVHRALGWKAGVIVLLLDMAKGLIPPLVAKSLHYSPDFACIAGIAAVLGHCFSPFLRFRGGKGIASMLGAALGTTPLIAAMGLAAFLAVFLVTRYVSLGSIIATGVAVASAFIFRTGPVIQAAYVAIAIFIIYKHRGNIDRLMKGQEPKTSLKGGKKEESVADGTQDGNTEDTARAVR